MKFNLKEYETVKERKSKFYKDFPDGRIIVENISDKPLVYAHFKATLYISKEDQKENLPKAIGYALEVRDTEMKVSQYGQKYESVNYSSWTENCEESAIGRALDNAGYSNKKPSREEMEKAEKMNNTMAKYNDKQRELLFRLDKLPLHQQEVEAFKSAIINGEDLGVIEKQIKDREVSHKINCMTLAKQIEKGYTILGYDKEKQKKINKLFLHLEDPEKSTNYGALSKLLDHLRSIAKKQNDAKGKK